MLVALLTIGTTGFAQGKLNKLKEKAGEENVKKADEVVKKEGEKIMEKGKEKADKVMGNKEAAHENAAAKKLRVKQ